MLSYQLLYSLLLVSISSAAAIPDPEPGFGGLPTLNIPKPGTPYFSTPTQDVNQGLPTLHLTKPGTPYFATPTPNTNLGLPTLHLSKPGTPYVATPTDPGLGLPPVKPVSRIPLPQ